ncbi:MAG: ABC transporter permease [Defluviitaleaceae bacterium]|nr:ABC transporter permease [Defluviitaleaceae bacterium]MCL2238525.1 ABC transporter permease [Defluviitaleaceae bacterium]
MTIFMHYTKRALKEPLGIAIYIVAPLVMVLITTLVNQYAADEFQGAAVMANGRDLVVSVNVFMNLIMFQFMGILLVVDPLHVDIRRDMRWRLLAAPVPPVKFVFGCMFGHYVFALLSGLLIIAGGFVMGGYMFTPWVPVAVLALVGIIAMLMGTLFFYLFKSLAVANTLGTVFTFGMAIPQGIMIMADFPTPVQTFGQYFTPLAWAFRAIIYSSDEASEMMTQFFFNQQHSFTRGMPGALMNLGLLAAFAAVLAVIVVLVSRRKAV